MSAGPSTVPKIAQFERNCECEGHFVAYTQG